MDHASLQDSIPAYVADRLDDESRIRLEAHMATCVECQTLVECCEALAFEFRTEDRPELAEHPDPVELRPDADAARISSHLDVCVTCAHEAAVWGERQQLDETTDRGGVPRSGRFWTWAAGIAALLVLGAIPLLLVLRPAGIRSGVVEVHHLESSQRGSPQSNVFTRQPGQPVRLILQVDLPPESFPLRVTLADGKERTVHSQPGVTSLLDGYLHYVCADADCPAGRYTLEVYESGSTEPALFFGFEVVEP